MLTQEELHQIRGIVREEVGVARKEVRELGNTLLDAIEINGQEQIQLEKRVERIEKHLSLPPVK
jgi:hypothetical protein